MLLNDSPSWWNSSVPPMSIRYSNRPLAIASVARVSARIGLMSDRLQ